MGPDLEQFLAHLFESPVKLGLFTASIASIGYVVIRRIKASSQTSRQPNPPGPPPRFLLGNLLQFPSDHFYKTFSKWHEAYGDIVSVNIVGMPIVILNSCDAAHELLNKRPNTTSGRSIGYMLREVMGWRWSLAFMQAEPTHANQRKMLRRGIGPQRVGSHDPKIENGVIQLMLKLQSLEGNPSHAVLRGLGDIVTEVTYGKKMLSSMGQELSSWNLEAMEIIGVAFASFWLVDIFQFLRFVPSWFPGAGFQRMGARSSWLADHIRDVPFAEARKLYESGEIGHSLATDLLDEFGPSNDARDALGLLYVIGAETTSGAITAFLHALYLFPEVSQKVYNEINEITNGGRMPKVADRSKMPYTEAVWMEIFRWDTFFPMGIPHVNTKDEILNGYLIKSGSQIIPNYWSMMMDKKLWGDPENFRPERFLGPDVSSLPDPSVIIFGYGMRVCPGMYLADRVGFHAAVATAALFEIVPLKGESRPNPQSIQRTDGVLRLPIGFECRFVPRDQRAQELLKAISLSE